MANGTLLIRIPLGPNYVLVLISAEKYYIFNFIGCLLRAVPL